MIRDPDSGEIRWGNVINGVLTAGILAVGTSVYQMAMQLSELRVVQAQRAQYFDQVPAVIAKVEMIGKDVESLKDGRSAATAKRFTSDDAEKLDARLSKEIARMEDRMKVQIERECAKAGRR